MATERKILEILREAGFDPIEDRGIVVKYAPENLSARLAQFFSMEFYALQLCRRELVLLPFSALTAGIRREVSLRLPYDEIRRVPPRARILKGNAFAEGAIGQMSKIVPGISPSMMCADALNLGADAVALEQAGAQFFHYDVMDGDFVPNFMLGPDVIRAVRKVSAVPADIHLMVKNPERHLHLFDLRPGDVVSVHQESTVHPQRALSAIRAAGAKAAVRRSLSSFCCAVRVTAPSPVSMAMR